MPDLAGSPALDTAIGLAFLFALLALIASGINEWIARRFALRAKDLEKALQHLLDRNPATDAAKPPTAKAVLDHPLIEPLRQPGKKGAAIPSYIPASMFASAVLDLLTPQTPGDDPFEAISGQVEKLPDGSLKRSLVALIRDAQGDRDQLRAGIEAWYDATMDRASGWYKRRAQKFLLIIGLLLAVSLNADAIQVATSLWHSPAQRAAVVAAAEKAASVDEGTSGTSGNEKVDVHLDSTAEKLREVKALQLPLGWSNTPNDPRNVPERWDILWKGLGLLLTGFAIALGAPFWFDLVGRGLSLRSSGRKPPPASNTSSE